MSKKAPNRQFILAAMAVASILAGCASESIRPEPDGKPRLLPTTFDMCKLPGTVCVNVILPPTLVEAGGLRTVSVTSGSGTGAASLTTMMEARLSKVMVDDKPYYTLVRSGAQSRQALFEIGSTEWSVNEQRETQERTDCVDGTKCKKTTTRKVSCTVRTATVGVVLKLRDPAGAELATRTAGDKASSTKCAGESGVLDTPAVILDNASAKALTKLQDALAVTVAKKRVRVMDTVDGVDDAAGKSRFAEGVAFAKAGRMDRACPIFGELSERAPKSVSVFYNLGFCEQVNGDWRRAFQWYNKADSNSAKPLDELKTALEETRPYSTLKP